LEQRILGAFADAEAGTLFRKTSCAVSYVHGLPDYNGHYGVRELCDICPMQQLALCADAHHPPSQHELEVVASRLPEAQGLHVIDISNRAAVVAGLDNEQPRYYLQHQLAFQIHDEGHPHLLQRHGRADIGWDGKSESEGDE
jgi:hypothetical protein